MKKGIPSFYAYAILMGIFIGLALILTRGEAAKNKILLSLFFIAAGAVAWRISQGYWFPSLPSKTIEE